MNLIPIAQQFQSFFFTIMLGVFLGIIIDGYRSIYHLWRPRPVIMILGDLILWLFLTGVVFFLLLLNNWGEVRAYVLIGMTLGLIAYGKWCSPYIFRLWRQIFKLIGRGLSIIFNIIFFYPLSLIIKLFKPVTTLVKRGASRALPRPGSWFNRIKRIWRR